MIRTIAILPEGEFEVFQSSSEEEAKQVLNAWTEALKRNRNADKVSFIGWKGDKAIPCEYKTCKGFKNVGAKKPNET